MEGSDILTSSVSKTKWCHKSKTLPRTLLSSGSYLLIIYFLTYSFLYLLTILPSLGPEIISLENERNDMLTFLIISPKGKHITSIINKYSSTQLYFYLTILRMFSELVKKRGPRSNSFELQQKRSYYLTP